MADTFYYDDIVCAEGVSHKKEKTVIKDTSNVNELRVALYPNPAKDYAILQLSKDISPLQLQITDAMGRKLVNTTITITAGLYQINTTSFSSGIYYVCLYSNSEKIYSGKLSIFIK